MTAKLHTFSPNLLYKPLRADSHGAKLGKVAVMQFASGAYSRTEIAELVVALQRVIEEIDNAQ